MATAFKMDAAFEMDANTKQLQVGINLAVGHTITPTDTEKGSSLTRYTEKFCLTQEIADEAFQWIDARVNHKALFFGKFNHFAEVSIIEGRVEALLPKKGSDPVLDLAKKITQAILQE